MLLCVDFDQISRLIRRNSSYRTKCSLESMLKVSYVYSGGWTKRYFIEVDMRSETRDTVDRVSDALEKLPIFREDCYGAKACSIRYDLAMSDNGILLDLESADIILKDGEIVFMNGFAIPKYKTYDEGELDIYSQMGRVLNLIGDKRDVRNASVVLPVDTMEGIEVVGVSILFGTSDMAKKFLNLAEKEDLKFMSRLICSMEEGDKTTLKGFYVVEFD